MEKMNTRLYKSALLLAVVLLAAAPVCMARNYVLLVEQTPMEGGILNPGVGVHDFMPGEKVTITATPRPGYRFIRWMGDVSAVDTSTTTVTLDAPKMLVAVFERVDFAMLDQGNEPLEDEGGTAGGGGGNGRLIGQSVVAGGGGGISPANSPLAKKYSASNIVPPTDDDDDETNDDIPVPVPEPGTFALISLGASIVVVRRKG